MKLTCGPWESLHTSCKSKSVSKKTPLILQIVLYNRLCGYPPFYDQNNVELFKQIMAGKYEFDRPWWDNISDKGKKTRGGGGSCE